MNLKIREVKDLYEASMILKKNHNKEAVYSTVRIEGEGQRIRLTLLDDHTTREITIAGHVDAPGAALIELMELDKVVGKIKKFGGPLEIQTDGFHLRCKHKRIEFLLGSRNSYQFPPIVEYTGAWTSIDAPSFLRALESTSLYMSNGDKRTYLCGVHLDGDTMIATDGHRMRKTKVNAPFVEFGGLTLPAPTANALVYAIKKIGPKEIQYAEQEGVILVQVSRDCLIRGKAIEGMFPDIEQVIPRPSFDAARVDRERFLEALDLVSIFASRETSNVRLTLRENELIFYASCGDSHKEGSAPIAVEYSGPAKKAGFDLNYLRDTMKDLTDDIITLDLIDTLSPATFTEDSRPGEIAIVMPMRL